MAETRYVIPTYNPPADPVKTALTAGERTAIRDILVVALTTPRTVMELLQILCTNGTLTQATKDKLDAERVQVALDNAVANGNLKVA